MAEEAKASVVRRRPRVLAGLGTVGYVPLRSLLSSVKATREG